MPNRTGQHRVVSTSKRGRQMQIFRGKHQQVNSFDSVKPKSGWIFKTDSTGKVIKVRSE